MVHPSTHQGEPWLRVIDWGTGFQQSERLQSKEAAHVYATYSKIWVRFFGHPATLVVDGGGEFSSTFALAAGQHGTLIHVIDPYTPWLNSRTERSHQTLRAQVALALDVHTPSNDDEYVALVYPLSTW